MTEHNSNQQKDKGTLNVYGGVGVAFILIIIFVVLATPGKMGNENQSNLDDVEVETIQVVQITGEATEQISQPETTSIPENTISTYDPESIANGEMLYLTCSACHGPGGTGIDGMGKDLVTREFSLTATDEELANVIINGRPIWDEANTTMLDMPPRGGNPTLTDEDVYDVVAYIRSLQSP